MDHSPLVRHATLGLLATLTCLMTSTALLGDSPDRILRNGVAAGEVADTPASRPLAKSERQLKGSLLCDFILFVDFDDLTAPTGFIETMPLTLEYEDLGVTFAGPSAGEGGAVLNEGGGFGVTGFTPPNFLAFNPTTYAQTPETFSFFIDSEYVRFLVGGPEAGPATLQCFDDEDNLVGEDSLTLAPELQPLEVAGGGIARCVFDYTAVAAVIDDLEFQPCEGDGFAEIPTLDPRGLLALLALLGALGVWHLRRQ
ncbi:MAG: IPTL-CTERM sorting domain-containing protein [Acidobacteriota bacterium]